MSLHELDDIIDVGRARDAPVLFANRRVNRRLGNYMCCQRRLGRGILSLSHVGSAKTKKVGGLPNRTLSEPLKRFVECLVEGDKRGAGLVGLCPDDHAYAGRLLHKCDIHGVTVARQAEADLAGVSDDKLYQRWQILLGERQTGNDSPEIADELEDCVEEMVKHGIITDKLGAEFRRKYL